MMVLNCWFVVDGDNCTAGAGHGRGNISGKGIRDDGGVGFGGGCRSEGRDGFGYGCGNGGGGGSGCRVVIVVGSGLGLCCIGSLWRLQWWQGCWLWFVWWFKLVKRLEMSMSNISSIKKLLYIIPYPKDLFKDKIA